MFKFVFLSSLLVLYFGSQVILCESDYDQETTSFYNMKCFQSQKDCVIYRSPEELGEIAGENEKINELKLLKRSNGLNSRLGFMQEMKRYFGSSNEYLKMHSTNDVNCLTDDCRILTAKPEKKNKAGLGNLACIGNPYHNLGSRCVIIEGLYIGK